jgi:thiamine pyrophosphate-dependent acetolactate synthase large subunit-like protein
MSGGGVRRDPSVELVQPDFASRAGAYGVPAREATPERLGEALAWAFEIDGPAVIVLRTKLHWIRPTA